MIIDKTQYKLHNWAVVPFYIINNILLMYLLSFIIIVVLFSGSPSRVIYYYFYPIIGMVLLLLQIRKINRSEFILLFIIISASFMPIFRGAFGFPLHIPASINFFVGAVIAMMAVRGAIAPIVARFICYFILGFFFLKMLSGVDPQNIIPGASRNVVSAYSVSLTMLLVILYKNGQIAPPILAPFLTLILSVWAVGRSGIISSSVIFLSMIFAFYGKKASYGQNKYLNSSRIRLFFLKLILITVLLFIMFFSDIYIYDYLQYLDQKGLTDVYRGYIIADYLDRITLITLFIGIDLASIPSIAYMELNPHNSYIYLHAYFGFFSIIIIFGVLISILKEFVSGNLAFSICAIACCFRFYTDVIAGGPLIYILLILFFDGWVWLINKFLTSNSVSPVLN